MRRFALAVAVWRVAAAVDSYLMLREWETSPLRTRDEIRCSGRPS